MTVREHLKQHLRTKLLLNSSQVFHCWAHLELSTDPSSQEIARQKDQEMDSLPPLIQLGALQLIKAYALVTLQNYWPNHVLLRTLLFQVPLSAKHWVRQGWTALPKGVGMEPVTGEQLSYVIGTNQPPSGCKLVSFKKRENLAEQSKGTLDPAMEDIKAEEDRKWTEEDLPVLRETMRIAAGQPAAFLPGHIRDIQRDEDANYLQKPQVPDVTGPDAYDQA